MAIHVTGSVAYDRILLFPGSFEDHLMPDKLHMINVSLLIDKVEEKFGGCAGNIAYTLSLLGDKPIMYSSVGRDFIPMQEKYEKAGVNIQNVPVYDDELTACCYIYTDSKGNQITGFNPAAMNKNLPLENYPKCQAGDYGIISPGNLEDMHNLANHFKTNNIPYVYDPGQNIPALSKEVHLSNIAGSEILIGNDYEVEMIMRITNCSKQELLQKTKCLITTLGENGCKVSFASNSINVPAPTVTDVMEPTGAGDAQRAGILFGLTRGLDIENSVKIGSICSAYCIEKFGTQEHSFTMDEFIKRYQENYGTFPLN